MRIVVTGASGQFGRSAVEGLLQLRSKRRLDVHALDAVVRDRKDVKEFIDGDFAAVAPKHDLPNP